MFLKISGKAVELMTRNGVISTEERELYEYGMYHILAASFHTITFCILAAIFGVFWEFILFYTCYKVLRKYAGGFHAGTSFRCYAESCGIILVVVAALRFFPFPFQSFFIFLSIFFSAAAIFFLAPVETPNKPLDQIETERFKKGSRIVCVLEIAAAFALLAAGLTGWSLAVSMGLTVMALALIAGKASLRAGLRRNS